MKWFGSHCQYQFFPHYGHRSFYSLVQDLYWMKDAMLYRYPLLNDRLHLTCYQGLQCHSAMCLDWREICNGVFNCENGEDEPAECLLLQTSECQDDEYRCRFGMCIPKTFLYDFSYDCMDFSDEELEYGVCKDETGDHNLATIECDYRLCPDNQFSCGNGQCQSKEYWDNACLPACPAKCSNVRELFFQKHLLDLNLSPRRSGLRNITSECSSLLICQFVMGSEYVFGYTDEKCHDCRDGLGSSECLEYFHEHCPSSFIFQKPNNLLYPFVQLLYYNTTNISSEWWLPTHLCYSPTHCPTFRVRSSSLLENLSCIARADFPGIMSSTHKTIQFFQACNVNPPRILADDKRLFYCPKSLVFISKQNIFDGVNDCLYGEDEDRRSNVTMALTVDLKNHFKCATNDQWRSRRLIRRRLCSDNADTIYLGKCEQSSDIACQFLRGVYFPPIHFNYGRICDGRNDMKSSDQNDTDETHCEGWRRYRRCDGFWDLKNGEDELNCSNSLVSYITRTVAKCHANQHYCVFRNGTMGCISKELAGDGFPHCLGATDERTTSCSSSDPRYKFSCRSGACKSVTEICNGEFWCLTADDELVCPWSYKVELDMGISFLCKNGTGISYYQRCNKVIDCQPDAEDEWLCDLDYEQTTYSLNFIEEYPSVAIDSPVLAMHKTSQLPPPVATNDDDWDVHFSDVSDWYCNQGFILKKNGSSKACLCPPGYYGLRCEYQSERVVVTLRIDTPSVLIGHENQHNFLRIIASLTLNDVVVHHESILHESVMKMMFYLNYPLLPPKQHGNWTVRIDAFLVTTNDVHFLEAWNFPVPFVFLPYNRLVLHLMLVQQKACTTRACIHGQCKTYLNPPHHTYCQCDKHWSGPHCDIFSHCSCGENGKCLGRFGSPVCVCPLGRMGRECYAKINPCSRIQCRNNGTCIPWDERTTKNFTCVCLQGYHGPRCEFADAFVDIHLSNLGFDNHRSFLPAVFVHFLQPNVESRDILYVQNRLLYRSVPLNKQFRAVNHGHTNLSTLIILQVFVQSNNFEYYIAAIIKRQQRNVTTTVTQSNQCPYVNKVLLNRTIQRFPLARKVKYYEQICSSRPHLRYFHDEAYLCFCDKDRLSQCLFFQRESTECTTNYCRNDGHCAQNLFNGLWDFSCVCSGCSYGSLCQLTTSQYALSLDAMLGQDILQDIPLKDQPILILIVLTTVVLIALLGFVSNVLSAIVFKQGKVREIGCGIYLLHLCLFGQLGLLALVARFIYLLHTQLNHVSNLSSTLWSCILVEYFLNVFPTLFNWITVCVCIERSVNMIKGTSFSKSDSVWWAKRVTLILTLIIASLHWHELFIHELTDDPRPTTRHTWCTITFRWPWLQDYRLIMNLINLIGPVLVSMVTTLFLLHKSTRMKQAFGKNKHEKTYLAALKKQLPLYGGPFSLVVLSLIRLTFSLTLVCIVDHWQKYVYLTAYCTSFLPLIGTFPIFVLTSDTYRRELKKLLERVNRRLKNTNI